MGEIEMDFLYLAIITALAFRNLFCRHLNDKVLRGAIDSTSNAVNKICEALLKNMAELEILRVRGPVESRPRNHGGAGYLHVP
jgi:uncharacterized radical SAM superfamily protein